MKSSGMFWDGFQWVPRADTGRVWRIFGLRLDLTSFALLDGAKAAAAAANHFICCVSAMCSGICSCYSGIANDVNASRKNRRLYLGFDLSSYRAKWGNWCKKNRRRSAEKRETSRPNDSCLPAASCHLELVD